MPDVETLQNHIRTLIVDCLELSLDPSELSPDADLQVDVGLDSAALLDLVSGIEERFGFEVDVEDVTEENFRSVAHLARYVQAQQQRAGGSSAC